MTLKFGEIEFKEVPHKVYNTLSAYAKVNEELSLNFMFSEIERREFAVRAQVQRDILEILFEV